MGAFDFYNGKSVAFSSPKQETSLDRAQPQ